MPGFSINTIFWSSYCFCHILTTLSLTQDTCHIVPRHVPYGRMTIQRDSSSVFFCLTKPILWMMRQMELVSLWRKQVFPNRRIKDKNISTRTNWIKHQTRLVNFTLMDIKNLQWSSQFVCVYSYNCFILQRIATKMKCTADNICSNTHKNWLEFSNTLKCCSKRNLSSAFIIRYFREYTRLKLGIVRLNHLCFLSYTSTRLKNSMDQHFLIVK